MNIIKYNKALKNKRNFEIARMTNLSQAMIGQLKSGRIYPSMSTMKKFYFITKGKIKPNDFFPLDDWKKELLTQKGETL